MHLETREPVPPNTLGVLHIKGGNVMKGYINNPSTSGVFSCAPITTTQTTTDDSPPQRPTPRHSPPTDGLTRATWASWTPTASCTCATVQRT